MNNRSIGQLANTKTLSTQKAKKVMVKQRGYLSQVWLGSQSYWQEMEVFGFPCQAISMLILQKKLQRILQRRKANPHSPKKKTAASPLTGFSVTSRELGEKRTKTRKQRTEALQEHSRDNRYRIPISCRLGRVMQQRKSARSLRQKTPSPSFSLRPVSIPLWL